MTTKLMIGSRGSQLALWQAHWIQARLRELGVDSEIEIIRTTGDKITDVPLAQAGGKGLFTKEIEDALLEGRVDCAVHSLKDLPTELPTGLILAAVPEREEPYDALVGARLADLPSGARVGTSSLRRAAQLRRLRPDLVIESVRGNLDTRLRKLDEGQYDAIVLAAAGLRRLGWADRIAELLAPEIVCPAVGQGALGIETRDRGEAFEICARLNHAETRLAVTAERAVLRGLGGGCQVPIGAHAQVTANHVHLRSVVAAPDGSALIEKTLEGSIADAEDLGSVMARDLLQDGGASVLLDVYGEMPALLGQRVLVTRPQDQAAPLSQALRGYGAEAIEIPAIGVEPLPFEQPELASFDWLIFTSVNGVRFFLDAVAEVNGMPKLCAIGSATAEAIEARGLRVDRIAAESVGEGVVALFEGESLEGQRFLIARASSARPVIPEALQAQGATVVDLPIYQNVVPNGFAARVQSLFDGLRPPDWVTFTSGSTVKNVLAAVGGEKLMGCRLASIGPVTSDAMRKHGLTVSVESADASVTALAAAIADFAKQRKNP